MKLIKFKSLKGFPWTMHLIQLEQKQWSQTNWQIF